MINKIVYLFGESIKSLWRTKLPSIVSSMAISVGLIVISLSYLLFINVDSTVLDFKNNYKIEVFFDKDLNNKNAIKVFNKILLINGVEEGMFIDKNKAASIFKKEFDENIENIIGFNPLPMGGIYYISEEFRDHSSIQNIIREIKKNRSVDSVLYEKDLIIKFDRFVKNILAIIFVISFFIILVAVFFVSNTILIIIYSKKEDILILKLLGASNYFIKIPYYLEGMYHGIIGSIISISFLYLFYDFFNSISIYTFKIQSIDFLQLSLVNILLGVILGFLGSSKALSSYVED